MSNSLDGRNQSESLLQTIHAFPDLLAQLGQMDADSGTVTIDQIGESLSFSHPSFSVDSDVQQSETQDTPSPGVFASTIAPASRSTVDETIDLPRGDSKTPAALPPEGFVPLRHVATLGEKKNDQAEYRLVGRLGAGGTGVVYQAHQRAIDREVAVKVLRDHLASDAHSRSRFLTEARVIGALDHPNVIALHELCVDDSGYLFYSMKRVDGTSWDQQIESMSLRENIETLGRVAEAMQYAHSRGIIHRDLKPENVMLGRYGEVLLADWGLAINQTKENSDLNRATIGGTPAYMAPELASGDVDQISFRTDVYLLGAILFQILTGKPPHHGETLMQCIRNAASNVFVSTRVEGELMDIAMKAMMKDSAERYESVKAMIAALDAEQVHRESTRLVKRAVATLDTINSGSADVDSDTNVADSNEDARNYERYRVAEALLHEAIEVWPENKRAHAELKSLLLKFARNAAEQGDLDLAITIYGNAGEGESEVATRIRRELAERAQTSEREAKFSAFFTHSPEAGLLTHVDTGEVLEANVAFSDLLGYQQETVVGRLMSELDAWKCPEARVEFVGRLKANEHVDNFEATFVHNDGSYVDTLISARQAEVNNMPVLISTIRDISLRKKAERKLQKSQRRLRDLQRLAGLGAWSYDVTDDEVYWSDELFDLVGRPKELGSPDFEEYLQTIHPDDRDMFHAAVRRTDEGAAYEVRIRQRTQHGRYRPVIARGQPILNDAGEVIELYGVMIPTGEVDQVDKE